MWNLFIISFFLKRFKTVPDTRVGHIGFENVSSMTRHEIYSYWHVSKWSLVDIVIWRTVSNVVKMPF